MTLPPHFFPVLIILEIGFLSVVLIYMHIQNRETTSAAQEIARRAQENERRHLENMAGVLLAFNCKTEEPKQ